MTDPAPQFKYGDLLDRTTFQVTGQLHRVSRPPGLDHDILDSIRVGRPFPGSLELRDIEESSATVSPPALGKDKLRRDLARIVTGMPGEILASGDEDQKAEASE